MPTSKRKGGSTLNSAKKSRLGSSKKIKNGDPDRAWKTSCKVDVRESPGNSRSSTPQSTDVSESISSAGKGRTSSMTSRDFIRQVLEFDKAPDSESESVDSEGTDSEDELKKAIKDSLASAKAKGLCSTDDSDQSSDNDVGSLPDSDLDLESAVDDSNMSFPTGEITAEQMVQSIYAPMPEFIPDNMPRLELPESSDDLLISKQYVLEAAEIYEILRVYRQIIRLSPFLFEDFVAALQSDEHNVLLHEVHSCLIKTLLREEDNNQTSFGPSDLKDSMNSLFFFNDAMTYPHVIQEYFKSDVNEKEFAVALKAISDSDYPTTDIDKKLTVLRTLCNIFLTSNSVREDLSADGFIKYDDHCRNCQKYVFCLSSIISCTSIKL